MSAATPIARCPLCEAAGRLGAPCTERVCARQGVHFIPEGDARHAGEQPPSQREPLVGQFVGDYLIIRQLGKGGFGKVLLSLQRPMFKLRAAVKLLEFQASDERSARKVLEKFQNEAAALAVLQHPNIVRLLQSGEHDGKPFMAMEYVPGSRTLQTEINRLVLGHGALEPDNVRHVLTQILNGLEAAHEQDLIHRDVKPENVMLQAVVGDPWHVKLVDFGLAKDVATNRDTSMVLGTVSYMSPEQIEGKDLGPWTDCYAVGVIAFELLLGRRPIVGRDAQEILRQKLNSRFDPFESVPAHGLSPTAVQFLQRALARWPEERFRSTTEMRAALGGVFEEAQGTAMFSRDLSALVDSEELARIKSEDVRLADQRKAIENEWARLDAARRDLESERVRLGSKELGRPEEVEYIAHGGTEVIASQVVPEASATVALPTGAPDLDLTQAPTPSVLFGAPAALQTGAPPTAGATAGAGRSRRWLFAGAAALLIGGVAVVLALPNDAETRVAESVDLAAPPDQIEPVAAAPEPDPPVAAAPIEVPLAAPDVVVADTVEVAPEAPASPPRGKETTLQITSTPPGADVLVDGVLVGQTPYTLKTRLGEKHHIELRAKGRPPEVREVVVEKEAGTVLVPLPARAAASRRPASTRPAAAPVAKDPETPAPVAKEPSSTNPIYVDDK